MTPSARSTSSTRLLGKEHPGSVEKKRKTQRLPVFCAACPAILNPPPRIHPMREKPLRLSQKACAEGAYHNFLLSVPSLRVSEVQLLQGQMSHFGDTQWRQDLQVSDFHQFLLVALP